MNIDGQALIAAECDRIKAMLLAKNAAYGNSALDPVRILSKADPVEQIRVRIDDKLSRLARGENAGEDVEMDLTGYFILLLVARRLVRERPPVEVEGIEMEPLSDDALAAENARLKADNAELLKAMVVP